MRLFVCSYRQTVSKPFGHRYQPVQEPNTLGEKIKKRRQELRMYQPQLAKQLGVSEATVSNWETNKAVPKIYQWRQLIEFLGFYPFPEEDTLSSQIKKYRLVRGLTQEALGVLVGVDGTTVCGWEKEENQPWPEVKKRLEKIINKHPAG